LKLEGYDWLLGMIRIIIRILEAGYGLIRINGYGLNLIAPSWLLQGHVIIVA